MAGMRRYLNGILAPRQQVGALTIITCTTLALTFTYERASALREILDTTKSDLTGRAALLSAHMQQSFDIASEMSKSVLEVRRMAEAQNDDPQTMHQRLKTLHGGSPLLQSIIWTNAGGDRIASSFFPDPPPLNLARTEHFKVGSENPKYADRPFIGRPVDSRVLKGWILPIGLRHERADGSFDGIAGGAIRLDYLAKTFGLRSAEDPSIVMLMRDDGAVLASNPSALAKGEAGTEAQIAELTALTRASGSPEDEPYLFASERLPNYEAALIVAMPRSAAIGAFVRQTVYAAALLIIALAGILALGLVIRRNLRRRETDQTQLRSNFARTQDFAASSGDWFWTTDERNRCNWVSEAAGPANGLPTAWTPGMPLLDLFSGADGDIPKISEALAAFEPFRDVEFRLARPGKDAWLRASGVPVFDESAAFRGYRGSVRDITELKQAEQRLAGAIAAFPGSFSIFDAEERLQFVNTSPHAVTRPFATQADIGSTYEALVRRTETYEQMLAAGEDAEAWIATRLENFRAASGSNMVRVKDRYYEVFERRTDDGGTVALRMDVTDLETALIAEREARADADRANNAKSAFLANMSHELRTPLNAILGFGQMMQIDAEKALTPTQRDYVHHVVSSGQHLLNLVKDVLDLSSVEAGKVKLSIENADAASIIERAVALLKPVADRAGVALTIAEPQEHIYVATDIQRLRQVMLNLISNAIKFNNKGGEVRVRVERLETTTRIVIDDTGFGIPPDRRDEVFKPFSRLGVEERAIDGAGIGLALSKKLVELMGGRIDFESRRGKGSSFWVELRNADHVVMEAGGRNDGDAVSRSIDSAAGDYTLLYVEDNPSNLRLMEHLVATLPNVVMLSAPSGPIGIELAEARQPDIIVLDINLPGMDGYDVLRHLQSSESAAAIPVIALSAAAMPKDVERGLAAGFYRYVTKPLEVTQFLDAVESALKSRHAELLADLNPEDQDKADDTGQQRA